MKLVVFDVDGTLIDSLAHIKHAMRMAFDAAELPTPDDAAIRSIIGLSLHEAMDRLHPDLAPARLDALIEGYKGSFKSRAEAASVPAPLFEGALDALARLHRRDDVILGIATGKSRRGLERMLDEHDLRSYFATTQCADDHPSKPHPAMLEKCLSDTAIRPQDAVMIGDTTFDLEMGRNAGFATIGVGWGYHETEFLVPFADHVIDTYPALDVALSQIWNSTS